MGLPVYNQQNLRIERYFYTGSLTLRSGQPMNFQESPATASSTRGFPFDIELPNADNNLAFAGIVAESSDGVVGPAYVDIIVPQPGDVLQVRVSNLAAIAVGDLLRVNGDATLTSVTATGSPQITSVSLNQGAFDEMLLDQGTIAVSAAQSVILAAAIAEIEKAQRRYRARALESLASVTVNSTVTTGQSSAGGPARPLLWVQFV